MLEVVLASEDVGYVVDDPFSVHPDELVPEVVLLDDLGQFLSVVGPIESIVSRDVNLLGFFLLHLPDTEELGYFG